MFFKYFFILYTGIMLFNSNNNILYIYIYYYNISSFKCYLFGIWFVNNFYKTYLDKLKTGWYCSVKWWTDKVNMLFHFEPEYYEAVRELRSSREQVWLSQSFDHLREKQSVEQGSLTTNAYGVRFGLRQQPRRGKLQDVFH